MIQARNDRILVRCNYEASKVIVAEDRDSQLLRGEVISAGPKASVSSGAHVVFSQACKETNPDGTMWIRDSDLVGELEAGSLVAFGTSPFYDVEGRS